MTTWSKQMLDLADGVQNLQTVRENCKWLEAELKTTKENEKFLREAQVEMERALSEPPVRGKNPLIDDVFNCHLGHMVAESLDMYDFSRLVQSCKVVRPFLQMTCNAVVQASWEQRTGQVAFVIK
jgi:hypothetical protein